MTQKAKFKDNEKTKNEIIAFVEQSIHRGGGTPIPQEQEDKWIAWLEKQGEQILANSAKTCKDDQQPHWNVGDTLAYYGFYSDREGECVLGKVTKVEFDKEQCDWFYTFEDGSVYDEQSLLEDQTYKKN